MTQTDIQPRLIRLKYAPAYLGMNRNLFNKLVRPYVPEFQIGIQGIAFDRVDLDDWVDEHKNCNERPASDKGDQIWDAKEVRVYAKEEISGTSTNRSSVKNFAKALEQATLKKRN